MAAAEQGGELGLDPGVLEGLGVRDLGDMGLPGSVDRAVATGGDREYEADPDAGQGESPRWPADSLSQPAPPARAMRTNRLCSR